MLLKKEITFECQKAWDEKFLELTGLKVGDKVSCNFSFQTGNRSSSYTSVEISTGTIILDEKGYGVLSDKKYSQSKEVRDMPNHPMNHKTHWVFETTQVREPLSYIVFS